MRFSICRQIAFHLTLAVTLVCLCASLATAQRFGQAKGPGVISKVVWHKDGKSVEFTNEGTRYKYDFEAKEKTEVESSKAKDAGPRTPNIRRRRRQEQGNTGKYIGRPSRGRQYTKVDSPDGKWQAQYKDWNLVLSLIHI